MRSSCSSVSNRVTARTLRACRSWVRPADCLPGRSTRRASTPGVTYQTNAVKHFKFTRENGKRRMRQKPSRTEVVACRPWLIAEIEAVRPQVIVCLGATAAQSLLGAAFRISAHRGELLQLPREADVSVEPEPRVVASVHPSAVVRDRTERRHEMYQLFVEDLRSARASLIGRRCQRR